MDRFEKFSLAMAEIHKCWHQIAAKELSRFGLKGPHAIYLVTLKSHPEGLSMPELCELLSKDKADVSRMMAILEKGNFVVKKGQYRAHYLLTDSGKDVAEKVYRKAQDAVNQAGADLDDSQRETFYNALDSIVTNLKRMSKEGILS